MSKDKSDRSWFGRHKILSAIGAIIVIAIIATAANGGDKPAGDTGSTAKSTGASSKTETAKKSTLAKIGQPVRDGKFEFTIKSVKCGVPSVSDSSGYLTKDAQGQYCLVDISVKNIGDEQQIFAEDDQKLLNAGSKEYSPDSVATLYNGNNSDVFVNEINPGNTVEGTMVYDIPKNQTPVTAELHDSSLSNGVKVSLK